MLAMMIVRSPETNPTQEMIKEIDEILTSITKI